jgi:NAD(P)-dependent dehydrogenase (short-subunit alcohol dehydrogenase family)
MTEFSGKGAIITRGGRGIGLAYARLITQRGGADGSARCRVLPDWHP